METGRAGGLLNAADTVFTLPMSSPPACTVPPGSALSLKVKKTMTNESTITENVYSMNVLDRGLWIGLLVCLAVWGSSLALAVWRLPGTVPDGVAMVLFAQAFLLPGCLLAWLLPRTLPIFGPPAARLAMAQFQVALWCVTAVSILTRSWMVYRHDYALYQMIDWINTGIFGGVIWARLLLQTPRQQRRMPVTLLVVCVALYVGLAIFRKPVPWSAWLNASAVLPFILPTFAFDYEKKSRPTEFQ